MPLLIAESKYERMKKELGDVIEIFVDDTANAEQTIKLISEIAEAAIAVQGLSEVDGSGNKAAVSALLVLDIGVSKLKQAVLEFGV